MKAGKSWSLRDVDEQTRATLLKAAEKSGLSVNDWLGTRRDGEAGLPPVRPPSSSVPMAAAEPRGVAGEDDPSREVREAISRLTARLGLMDEKARGAVAGLPARLAEIENRLAALVETRQSPEERARALTDASTMIDALVRDIDGAALRASAFGGKPPSTSAATAPAATAAEPAAPPPRLVAPAAKPAQPVAPAPMSPAAEQLADIRYQLDALLSEDADQPTKPPSRAASEFSETPLRTPDTRADKAEPQAAQTPVSQSSADRSGAADHLHRLETQIGEIMSRLPAKKDADLASAIREISSRQRAIDERAEAAAMRREQRALSDAVAAMHGEVAGLATKVSAIGQRGSGDDGAVRDLAQRIETLAADRPVDRTLLEGIRSDLEHLKTAATDTSLRATIGDLEARYGEVARRVDEFIAKVPDGARIDALGEEIASLRQAFESGRAGSVERLEARLDEIARTVASAAEQPAIAPTVSVDLTKLEQRFDSLAKTVGMALSRSPIAPARDQTEEIGGRLDEIAARLGKLLAKADAVPVASPVPSPTVAALEGRLSQMAANINGLLDREATGDAAPVMTRIEERLDVIAESVDGLFMGMPPSETNAILQHIDERFDRMATLGASAGGLPDGLGRIEERLDRVAADLEHFGAPAAGTIDEDGLNLRLDHMAEALSGLARNVPSMVEIETLHGRLQGLDDRIENVSMPETTIAGDLDDIRTEMASIRAVHQRLQTLTERIDSMAAVQHQPLLAIAEIKDGIVAIRAMHDRIQTITDRIDRMSAAQRDPLPPEQMKAGFAAMRTVQDRVQELSDRFEAMAPQQAPSADTVDEIRAGVSAINAVHQEMRSLSERISGMAVQRAPVAVLEDIKKDIVVIRSEIAGRGRPHSTEPLERLVAELAKQVATVSRTPSDPAGIADLANRVNELAGELEDAKPGVKRLEDIETRVARLQENLADNRKESIEAAKTEARAVVQDLSRMVATGEVDPNVIGALVQDLESIKNMTGYSARGGRSKLDAVNTTLAQVVSRVSQLEGEASRRAVSPEPRPAVPQDWSAPLAGPIGAPSLPADASAEEPAGEKEPRERRADFIAAARRAAQAAAAEASRPQTADGDEAKGDKPGALARFSQAILNRKRTLLLAAAAVVLAVGALQIFAGRLSADTRMAANVSRSAAVDVALAAGAAQTAQAAIPAPAFAAPITTAAAAPAPLLVAPATIDRDVAFAPPVYPPQSMPAQPLAAATLTGTSPAMPTAAEQPAVATAPAAVSSGDAGNVIAVSATPASLGGTTSYALLDHAIGSQKLTSAALNGEPAAEFEVGSRYAAGTLVPRDMTKAASWYQRAANDGLAVAEFRLGSLYERGDGVTQDLGQAVAWYQRAADQGNVNAMHNLAVLLSNGVNGAAPDPKLALKWFLTAGNYGVRDSEYNLGVIYARGLGTAVDLQESYKWFAIAAQAGDTDAGARRDEIAQSLSRGQLTQATTALAAWRAKQPNTAANAAAAPAGGWDSDAVNDADRQGLVKTIQTLLASAGYDPGPADGRIGPKTTQAVKSYQGQAGVAQTGQLDTTLLASLSAAGH